MAKSSTKAKGLRCRTPVPKSKIRCTIGKDGKKYYNRDGTRVAKANISTRGIRCKVPLPLGDFTVVTPGIVGDETLDDIERSIYEAIGRLYDEGEQLADTVIIEVPDTVSEAVKNAVQDQAEEAIAQIPAPVGEPPVVVVVSSSDLVREDAIDDVFVEQPMPRLSRQSMTRRSKSSKTIPMPGGEPEYEDMPIPIRAPSRPVVQDVRYTLPAASVPASRGSKQMVIIPSQGMPEESRKSVMRIAELTNQGTEIPLPQIKEFYIWMKTPQLVPLPNGTTLGVDLPYKPIKSFTDLDGLRTVKKLAERIASDVTGTYSLFVVGPAANRVLTEFVKKRGTFDVDGWKRFLEDVYPLLAEMFIDIDRAPDLLKRRSASKSSVSVKQVEEVGKKLVDAASTKVISPKRKSTTRSRSSLSELEDEIEDALRESGSGLSGPVYHLWVFAAVDIAIISDGQGGPRKIRQITKDIPKVYLGPVTKSNRKNLDAARVYNSQDLEDIGVYFTDEKGHEVFEKFSKASKSWAIDEWTEFIKSGRLDEMIDMGRDIDDIDTILDPLVYPKSRVGDRILNELADL